GRPDVMFVIQRVLEAEGKLTLLGQNRVIRPNPWFRLFATTNTVGLGDTTGLYHGTQAINQGQMDRWNIVTTLNYLPAAVEAQIVLAKSGEYDDPGGKAIVEKMIKVAELSRQGFINGDISTVMSPRTVISWAQNAHIFSEVVYASDLSPPSGKTARVPSPGARLEPKLVAEARGAADAAALRLRYHDPRLHARVAPIDADARAVFEALETARVEALGARAMGGVRSNLAQLTEARVRADAIVRARSADEVPLATAVGLIARERLTGEAPPAAAARGLKLVAPWIEDKAAAELDALALTLDDQAAFAKLSRRLLEDLDLAAAEDLNQEDPQEAGDDAEGEEGGSEDSAEQGDEGTPSGGDVEMRGEQAEDENAEGDSNQEMDAGEEEVSAGDDLSESMFAAPGRRNWDLSPETDYKAYTTRFDEAVESQELCDEEELGR